jgi:hypothetical protein
LTAPPSKGQKSPLDKLQKATGLALVQGNANALFKLSNWLSRGLKKVHSPGIRSNGISYVRNQPFLSLAGKIHFPSLDLA